MKKKLLFLSPWLASSCLLLFLLLTSVVVNATDRYFPTDYATIQDAINASSSGDVIHVAPGTYVVPAGTTISVNKSVTIDGGSAATTKLQTSGTAYLFLVTAPNAAIKNFEIEKTDLAGVQNIVGVQGNNFELAFNNIHGGYTMGAPEVERGVEVSAVTSVNIHDNTFRKLRQPGYVNTATGSITNNLTQITRGWVVVGNASVSFMNNTWGSGADVNYYDIAIIPGTPNNYPDIVSISNNNNDAIIENQNFSPAILSIVHVDKSKTTSANNGSILDPYTTIAPSIPRVAPGGKIWVAAGTYNENVVITKPASLRGANYGVSCASGRGAESIVSGTGGSGTTTFRIQSNSVTIDGFTVTNHAGSLGISSQTGSSNLDIEHNVITDIGNNTTGSASSWGVDIEAGTATNSSNITVSNNCINNIRGGANPALAGSAGKSNNGSGGGILFGSASDTKTISTVIINSNIISQITASTVAFTDGGKGAYGVQLNVGAKNATGSVSSASITNNEISALEGLWAHGVGLEGRTPGAQLTNNLIHDLADHKGNTDNIGVRVEDNDAAGSVVINSNSFTNMKFGISNTMSATVNGTCNWYGSADPTTVTSMIDGHVTYIPYLTSGGDGAATGFQPTGNCDGNPSSSISFTATSSNGSASTSEGNPVKIRICSGGSFNYSNYSSTPSAHVGVLENLVSSGNVTYNGGGVPPTRPQIDFGVAGTPSYFNGGPYGPYGLSSGTSGIIDETFTPYYDADNTGTYTTGDVLGTSVTLHYDIYTPPTTTTCPGNITQNTDAGACSAAVSYDVSFAGSFNVVSYTFSGATTAAGSGTGSGSTFNKGVTNVTVTANNGCGNVACQFIVTVQDHENPGIVCPANITANPTSLSGANVTYTAPIVTDNCLGATSTRTAGPASGSSFPVGTTTVTYKATDASGNSATCSFTVTVKDPYCDRNKNNPKVNVCRNGSTLCVSENAVSAHLSHGDKLGECSWYASPSITQTYSLDMTEMLLGVKKIQVSPNPAFGQFNIQLNNLKASKAELIFMDQNGRTIEKKSIQLVNGQQNVMYSTRNIASGMYFVKVVSEDGVQTAKVVVQH